MSGVTIAHAENLLVRIEAADGTVGWGEAASAPTMTGDTQGGLVAAVRDHLAPLLVGQDAWTRPHLRARAARGADGQHRRAFGDRDGAARSRRARVRPAAVRPRRPAAARAPLRRCGCSAIRPSRQDVAEAQRKDGRGLPLLQAQDRHQAARARHRRHARRARGAGPSRAALRRRQLRAHARGRAALCRGHTRGRAPLPRAAARRRPILRASKALARASPVADRRRRRHPFAGRHRGACALRRARPLAQADQARRLRGGDRGGRPVRAPRARRSTSPPRSPSSSIGSAAAVHLACAVPSTTGA